MIIQDKKELSARYYGRRAISAVYIGLRLLWQAVASCFGSGWWLRDKPWAGSDLWRGR